MFKKLLNFVGFCFAAVLVAGWIFRSDDSGLETRCPGDGGSLLYNLFTPVGDDCPTTPTNAAVDAEPVSPRMVARGRCRQIILTVLHNPRSAEWDDARNWRFTEDGDGRYTIFPTLRATNAMGATIRTQFRCQIQQDGDSWSLVALEEI